MNWPIVPIGKVITSTQYGLSISSDADGNIPIVGMKDIQGGRVRIDHAIRVALTDDQLADYKLRKGDILINRTNSPDLVGKTGLLLEDQNAVFASYLVRIKIDELQADPEFISYCMNSEAGQRQMKMLSTRAISQANINPTIFKKHFHIPFPPLDAQHEIAQILRAWDTAIEKTERLLDAKEKRFAWLVSRLISGGKHIHGHIRDVTNEVSERNSGRAIDRVLSVTNSRGFVLPEYQFVRRVASSDLSNYKVVTREQYAYNPSRINVGSIARLDGWDKGVLSPMYVVFKFHHWTSKNKSPQSSTPPNRKSTS